MEHWAEILMLQEQRCWTRCSISRWGPEWRDTPVKHHLSRIFIHDWSWKCNKDGVQLTGNDVTLILMGGNMRRKKTKFGVVPKPMHRLSLYGLTTTDWIYLILWQKLYKLQYIDNKAPTKHKQTTSAASVTFIWQIDRCLTFICDRWKN